MQDTGDSQIILELYCYHLPNQLLEVGEEELLSQADPHTPTNQPNKQRTPFFQFS
jgi:hypothetical protein